MSIVDVAKGGTSRPLLAALAEEVERLELLIVKVWQGLTAACVVGGLGVYLLAGLSLGLWSAATFAVYFLWFSLDRWLRTRRRGGAVLMVAAVAVESTLPWALMYALVHAQGPRYALGSWLPPLAWAAIMVAAVARLRPMLPAIIGTVSAITFYLFYFAVLEGVLRADGSPLLGPSMQATRALSLFVGGFLTMAVAHGLRSAIVSADRIARERDLFGKYRIAEQLASGGMGTVFSAVYCPEGGFERRVAIKRIHPHLAEQERFVDAFRREAELSARLAHPNIVQVLDFGRIGESYFLAMEFIEGMTLASLMRRMRTASIPFEPRLVAYLGREVLAGLGHSHHGARDGAGNLLRIIHRDLAPPNVLLSKNGEVKISDFGVARALRDAASEHTKTVVGHSAYMAPEQARALPVDERSDLFSLGVILWELLVGRSLFDRGSDGPTLIALIGDPVPDVTELRNLDPAWRTFMKRALARDPDERFPSAAIMALELAAIPDARASTLTGKQADELAHLLERASALPERSEDESDTSGARRAASDQPTRVVSGPATQPGRSG